MRLKPKLPDDVKQICLWHVRGYDRRVKVLARREDLILRGEKYRRRGSARQGVDLASLCDSVDGRSVAAVSDTMRDICADIASEEVRGALCAALFLNCRAGKKNPYERLHLPGITRDEFYKRKHLLLYGIAVRLGMWDGEN